MTKKVKLSANSSVHTHTSDNVNLDIVVTATSPGGEQTELVYEDTTTSGGIVNDSTAYIGADLEPESIEILTENVERSRGLLDGGYKLGFTLPGGWGLNFEKKSTSETKTTKKVILRPKK